MFRLKTGQLLVRIHFVFTGWSQFGVGMLVCMFVMFWKIRILLIIFLDSINN